MPQPLDGSLLPQNERPRCDATGATHWDFGAEAALQGVQNERKQSKVVVSFQKI